MLKTYTFKGVGKKVADIFMQKVQAINVLEALKNNPYITDQLVMGGAPRDWAHYNPARDIDFYVRGSICAWQLDKLFKDKFLCDLKRMGAGLNKDGKYVESEYANHAIKWVFEGVIPVDGGISINVIVLHNRFTLGQMLDTFSINLCKMTYNCDGLIQMTSAAARDFVNRTLTQERKPFLGKKGQEYIEKIKNKFPDHKFVDMTGVVEIEW